MSYERKVPPKISEEQRTLLNYILDELEAIERAQVDLNFVKLVELHVAPERPRAGMIVLADGSDWDPGSGAGYYGYYGGSWSKLG